MTYIVIVPSSTTVGSPVAGPTAGEEGFDLHNRISLNNLLFLTDLQVSLRPGYSPLLEKLPQAVCSSSHNPSLWEVGLFRSLVQ